MIIVTGTKRSGTSMWMQLLVTAGLPPIGDRFPEGWEELVSAANPDGFYESELSGGIYYRTNPHPLTGAYLAPQQTRDHAVKVLAPGLVRTDVAFIDRCIATVRSWREYVVSTRRVQQLQSHAGVPGPEQSTLPLAIQWWSENFALLRDMAIRGLPMHVVSYDSLLREPVRVATEVLGWVGRGDPEQAATVVRPGLRTGHPDALPPDAELAEGLEPRILAVFDELYATIDQEQPLSPAFVRELNHADEQLRPVVLEHRARVDAESISGLIGRR